MSEPFVVPEAEPAPLQYPASFYLRLNVGKKLPAAMVFEPSDGMRITEFTDGSAHVKPWKWTPEYGKAFAQAVLDGVFDPEDVMTIEQALADKAGKVVKTKAVAAKEL